MHCTLRWDRNDLHVGKVEHRFACKYGSVSVLMDIQYRHVKNSVVLHKSTFDKKDKRYVVPRINFMNTSFRHEG